MNGRGQVRLIAGDYGNRLLLDIEGDRVLTLNRVAAEMWELLRLGKAESEIVAEISGKYAVDGQRVEADLRRLLTRLSNLRLSPSNSLSVVPPERKVPDQKQPSYPWYGTGAGEKPRPSKLLVLVAFIGLALFDLILTCSSLKTLCASVSLCPLRKWARSYQNIQGQVCSAVEHACVYYPKQALCLQRSAVTACILKLYGVDALMMIGLRPYPFLGHAWVEVNGCVVNDWRGVTSFYQSVVAY